MKPSETVSRIPEDLKTRTFEHLKSMQVHWYLYRFDHNLYLQLRPMLRAAVTPEGLEALGEGPEVEAIADALEAQEMSLTEARSALVQALCCVGEPVPFTMELSRLISTLERTPGMEEGAALLGEMLSGKRLEPWLLPSAGLSGFLTPQDASAVHVAYTSASPRALRRRSGRRVRRGGLIRNGGAWCIDLVRHLCGLAPRSEEMLRLLGALLAESTQHGCGIAAVSA